VPPGPIGRARDSLRALEALDRLATQGGHLSARDLEELRGWAGWGPMAPALAAGRSGAWQEIGEQLEWLLPPGQLREAEQATPNAFYTPPGLAAVCWQILRGLGFDRGRILEPGCGAGAFIAAEPADVEATWVGVEQDPVTARIAQLLHPAARIISERLQNTALPAHSMDAVIGNVPFGETPVYDPTAPKEVTRSLHNYCIWRSARTLRPGGVAVLITSRYTMDGRDPGARQAIAAEAELIGAIRLPGDALSAGGTEVVTDIVVLRRRGDDGAHADPDWTGTVRLADACPGHPWGYEDRVNQWFVTHPATVLGEFRPDHAARYGRTVRVDRADDGAPLEDALAEAASRLISSARARGLAWEPPAVLDPDAGSAGIPQRADGRKERSFHLIGGTIRQVHFPSARILMAAREDLASASARMAALTEDAGQADHPALPVAKQGAPASQPAGDQFAGGAPGEPARTGRDGSPGPPPVPAVVTPAEITAGKPAPPRLPGTHPALLARLDGAAEPLFPLPPAAAEHPAAGQAACARRPAEQATSGDSAAQPALFDLPPPPAPRRPAMPDQSWTRTPRK